MFVGQPFFPVIFSSDAVSLKISDSIGKNPGFTQLAAGNTNFTKNLSRISSDSSEEASDQNGIIPGISPEKSGITYSFTKDVIETDLGSMTDTEGGVLISGGTFAPGDVLVDKENNKAVKVLFTQSNGALVIRPAQLSEVFKNLKIAEQKIPLENVIVEHPDAPKEMTRKNTQEVLPFKSVRGQVKPDTPAFNKTLVAFNSNGKEAKKEKAKAIVDNSQFQGSGIVLSFPDETVVYDEGGMKVYLEGDIGIGSSLDIEYDWNDEYKVGLSGAQYLDVNVRIEGQRSGEDPLFIPFIGINADFGIAELKGGLGLLINIDGTFQVIVDIDEGAYASAGLAGDVDFFWPSSVHPYHDSGVYSEGDCDFGGDITCTVQIGVLVNFEVLGYDLFELQFSTGFEGYASVHSGMLNYGLNFIMIFYIDVFDLNPAPILNVRENIFEREKVYTGGYHFYVSDLSAYEDRIIGLILKDIEHGDSSERVDYPLICGKNCPAAYANGDVNIEFFRDGQLQDTLQTTTNDLGVFDFTLKPNVDVVKGDYVIVSIPNVEGAKTSPIESSIPFKEVIINYGEFFEDQVDGFVPKGKPLTIPGVPDDILPPVEYPNAKGGLVHITAKNPNGEITTADTSLSDESQFHTVVQGGTYGIMPGAWIAVTYTIDGFVIPSATVEATNPIDFFKYRIDNEGVIMVEQQLGAQTLQLPVPNSVDHNLEHHIVAINKLGTKPLTEDVTITVELGQIPTLFSADQEYDLKRGGMCGQYTADSSFNYEVFTDREFKKLIKKIMTTKPLTTSWASPGTGGAATAVNLYWGYDEFKKCDIKPEELGAATISDNTPENPVGKIKINPETMNAFIRQNPGEELVIDNINLADEYLQDSDRNIKAFTPDETLILDANAGPIMSDKDIVTLPPVATVYSNEMYPGFDCGPFFEIYAYRVRTTASYEFEEAKFYAREAFDNMEFYCKMDEKKEQPSDEEDVKKLWLDIRNYVRDPVVHPNEIEDILVSPIS